jgi:hypothetical protein
VQRTSSPTAGMTPGYRQAPRRSTQLDPARAALIAGNRLVRDPVLPHAWSVFHCVATPRIPVHHAQELPIGGKLPSYFLLESLTQSFPLEWRDVLRYQRLGKLHTAHSAPRKPCCGMPTCRPPRSTSRWPTVSAPRRSTGWTRSSERPRRHTGRPASNSSSGISGFCIQSVGTDCQFAGWVVNGCVAIAVAPDGRWHGGHGPTIVAAVGNAINANHGGNVEGSTCCTG